MGTQIQVGTCTTECLNTCAPFYTLPARNSNIACFAFSFFFLEIRSSSAFLLAILMFSNLLVCTCIYLRVGVRGEERCQVDQCRVPVWKWHINIGYGGVVFLDSQFQIPCMQD